ncbi:hypothetical protein AB8P51_11120 [Muriicola sp. SD30]|uniref:hypothetical protein n=1 Tax=Muriicola sp. SD30 TaxID=3240936 RepID=UPI00350F1740
MKGNKLEIQSLLETANIGINGSRPLDFGIKDERLYKKLLIKGSPGLGEVYMDSR